MTSIAPDAAAMASVPTELCLLAAAIASGEVSAEQAVYAAIARAEAAASLNAVVAIEADKALEIARDCDAERAAGTLRGPLHGVPMLHKDMFFRAGELTEAGSLIWQGYRPDTTSPLIARLEAAGAITLGRLHMAEFALGPTGHNAHLGRCRNPWQPEAISGGSSSGSGAAVGARIVTGALGSDTGGSVRLPAAFCGVAGLKPTNGLLPLDAMMPLSQTCDTAGPLATSSRALARMMTALVADGTDYEEGIATSLAGVRIGVPTTFYTEDLHPEIAAALAEARTAFADFGATVVDVEVPAHDDYTHLAAAIAMPEGARFHAVHLAERPQDFGEQVRNRLEAGAAMGEAVYEAALARRLAAQEEMLSGPFAQVDLLLTPATRLRVPLASEVDARAGDAMQAMVGQLSALTRTISMLGFPALVTPMGQDSRGLPLALQLVGVPHSEALLLRAGHAFEVATGWILPPPAFAEPVSLSV